MSSSSSSTSIRRPRPSYDVFLSFRGEDTRHNIVGHLYTALLRNGIKTFLDDEGIRRGQDINETLSREIEESRIAVIVFSKNYSGSRWCLDELVMIMARRDEQGLIVYPVFYDVNPSDVRNLTGEFGEAFSIHQDAENVYLWRRALQQTVILAGWDLTNPVAAHEAICINKIVEAVICELGYGTNCIDENLIGIDHRMRNMMSVNLGEHNVRIIGILGMPGSGKTTIARAVFNDIREQFEGHCFLHNISEVPKTQEGLVSLQKKMLSGVLGHEKVQFNDEYEGCKKIKLWLSRLKVLIVLDKVDTGAQLKALAGARSWFGDGSRIIITTTDERLLLAHKLVDSTHNVILLNDEEAIQLLNNCAFKDGIPTEAHRESLARVIRYANGHPDALKRLGKNLINKTIDEWKDTIDSLAKYPEAGIDDMLQLSLLGLSTQEKEIFLDIACFFNGWIKDEVIDILDSCELYATSGLGTLKEKSLVTFSRGIIQMHNLVLETGRNMVRQEHPDDPSRQSRLWHPDEVKDVLMENTGTECIKATVISNPKNLDARSAFDAFTSMKRLRLLLANTQRRVFLLHGSTCFSFPWILEGSGPLNYMPHDLKWLTWDYFNLESWPTDFRAKKLVGLQMQHSSLIELGSRREEKFLQTLKFLNLSFSKDLLRIPSLGFLPHLKKLNLEFCSSLVEVDPSIRNHRNLVHLNLRSCVNLESLPLRLEMTSLEVLNLSFCSKLTKIPEFVGMTNLLELDLSHDLIEELPSSIGDLPSLIYLDISNCRNLTSIPQSIWLLDDRAEVILYGCPVSENGVVRPQE